jgi:hypothetical protein
MITVIDSDQCFREEVNIFLKFNEFNSIVGVEDSFKNSPYKKEERGVYLEKISASNFEKCSQR